MLFVQYMQNNDAKITFEAIDKPDSEFKSHMEVLEAGLAHERYVTGLINNIYGSAYDVKDFRTMQFLDWFVKEQGEEETNATDLIKKNEPVRFRSEESVSAGSGARGTHICCSVTGTVTSCLSDSNANGDDFWFRLSCFMFNFSRKSNDFDPSV